MATILAKNLLKLPIKALNGYVWVEKLHHKHNENPEKSKIFDQNYEYFAYFDTKNTKKRQFKLQLKELMNAKSVIDFATTFDDNFIYDKNLEDLLLELYENWDLETLKELTKNLKYKQNPELLKDYSINQVGDYYFAYYEN